MNKIAQIVNETPEFGWASEGCNPCECGNTGACLQEKNPFLESIPTEVLNYMLAFGLILLVVLIVVFLVLFFIKLMKFFKTKK